MSKEALLFPGQGPAKDIVQCYTQLSILDPNNIRRRITQAQEALNTVHGSSAFDIIRALGDVSSPQFQKTALVQPVIYALCIAAYELAKDKLHPAFVAGHSLGEYPAITIAGVISPEEGAEIVVYRGAYMQEESNRYKSKLVSISGLTLEQIAKMCETRIAEDTLAAQIALINGPLLVVVGCAETDVLLVEQLAKSAGAKRSLILQTAGAFHTFYMQEVVAKLRQVFSRYNFGKVQTPVVANIDGEVVESGIYPVDNLLRSLINPVKWVKSHDTLRQRGVDTFIEVGPGSSLQSLARLNGVPREQIKSVFPV